MNKSYRKMGWLSLLILTFASPVLAQAPIIEPGQPDELRGVTKVFVDTGLDVQQREVIVREIKKQLPDLEIVSRPEESDIHLRFFLKETRDGRTEGVGTVVKLIDANRERALCSFKEDLPPIYAQHSIKSYGIEYTMPLKFAREFVKAYKKANG
ncbi:MAG TPA: hypothetical protein VE715_09690 [Blastocatellia bacterium]|nr:hypothetical protein [Blastocatellia bacterium]